MPGPLIQATLCAAAGVLGIATGLPARDFADTCSFLMGRTGPPNFKRLVAKVERELGGVLTTEFGGEATIAPVRATVEDLLARHGADLQECVALDLDPARVADAVLRRGASLLTDEVKQRERLCRTIIERVYAALLADPAALNQLLPETLRALLGLREQIERLPEAVAGALRDLETRLILSDGQRILAGEVRGDSTLLRPDYAVVPFDPRREAAVRDLLAWCEDGPERAVRLVHGPGGMGKSRLLIEVAARLRERRWRVGFLEPDADAAPPGTFARLVDGEMPVCVVVDYAETRRETLVRLLRRMRWGGAPKLRLALLARAEAEWWRHLGREDRDARELMAGYADSLALPPLPDDAAARRAVFDAAVAAFSRRLGFSPAEAVPPPDLALPHFRTVLLVHLAALAAVRGRRIEDAEALIREIVDRDRGAWDLGLDDLDLPRGQYRRATAQAATLATLTAGAADEEALQAIVARAPELAGAPTAVVGSMARLLARLYPDGARVGALRPDLLGEHLADVELSQSQALLDAAFGESSEPDARRSGLVVLARLAARKPASVDLLDRALVRHAERLGAAAIEVAAELGGLTLDRLTGIFRQAEPARRANLAHLLESHLPWPTVVARELSAEVGAATVAARREAAAGGDEPERADLARSLSNLGIYLSQLNRREEALAAEEEAVALYGALAAARPDAFNPDLARSLNNLGDRLEAAARLDEAVAADREPWNGWRLSSCAFRRRSLPR